MKKPIVQIEVLKEIALKGKLAIIEADYALKPKGHHHPDISKSFKTLWKKKLIERAGYSNGSRAGRPKEFFKITRTGIVALLSENVIDQKEYWLVMLWFCYLNRTKIEQKVIDKLFHLYLNTYLEYPNVQDYLFPMLDGFNEMCDRWIDTNISYPYCNITLTPEQKVLEVLALDSQYEFTIEELSKETGESVQNIERAISKYSNIGSQFSMPYVLKNYELINTIDIDNELGKILPFCLIVVTTDDTSKKKFSLSFFGVMLTLAIIWHHNFIERLQLYLLDKYPIEDAFNKIIKSNVTKFSTLFGEWDILRYHLSESSVYNFEIILDRKARERFSSPWRTSVSTELYNALRKISFTNVKSLLGLYLQGRCIEEFLLSNKLDRHELNYGGLLFPIYEKWLQLGTSIMKSELPNAEYMKKADSFISPQIEVLEKSLKLETSFLYCLKLTDHEYLPSNIPTTGEGLPGTILDPEKALTQILDESKRLKNELLVLTRNCLVFQEKALGLTTVFYDRIFTNIAKT